MAELTSAEEQRLRRLINKSADEYDPAAAPGETTDPKPEKDAKPTTRGSGTTAAATGKSKIFFDVVKAKADPRYDVVSDKKWTQPWTSKKAKEKGVTVPDFITGGTKAQRQALARKIANTTIDTKTMSASDIAKVQKARLWYTGQTAGGGKQGSDWSDASNKAKLLGKDTVKTKPAGKAAKTEKAWKPRKPTAGTPGTLDKQGRLIVNDLGQRAPKGYFFDESGTLISIPKAAAPVTTPAPSAASSGQLVQPGTLPSPTPDAEEVTRDTAKWLSRPGSTMKAKRDKNRRQRLR